MYEPSWHHLTTDHNHLLELHHMHSTALLRACKSNQTYIDLNRFSTVPSRICLAAFQPALNCDDLKLPSLDVHVEATHAALSLNDGHWRASHVPPVGLQWGLLTTQISSKFTVPNLTELINVKKLEASFQKMLSENSRYNYNCKTCSNIMYLHDTHSICLCFCNLNPLVLKLWTSNGCRLVSKSWTSVGGRKDPLWHSCEGIVALHGTAIFVVRK